MERGLIFIDDSTVDEISSKFNRTRVDLSDSSNSANRAFSGIMGTGLMGNSVRKISQQMEKLSSGISDVDNMVKSHRDNMFSTENALADRGESIIVPTDFDVYDSANSHEQEELSLHKKDGLSVNAGEKTTDSQEMEFEDLIEYNENLKKVLNDYELEHGRLPSYKDRHIDLGNINNNTDTEKVDIDESTIVEKKDLNNIEKESTTEKQEIDTSTDIIKKNLASINGTSGTEKVSLEQTASVKTNKSSEEEKVGE